MHDASIPLSHSVLLTEFGAPVHSRSVDNVEPWMSGNARGPTTAFNLLYRLCQLRPTHGEIRMMLDHKDSPYIRAVGF